MDDLAITPVTPTQVSARVGYGLAATLALAAVLAFAIDMQVARVCRPNPQTKRSVIPRDVRKLVTLAEAYAHGAGVACIAISLWLCDDQRRRRIPRLLFASFGAGLAADVIKFLLVARTRPHSSNLDASSLDTFVAFVPLLSSQFASERYTHAYQSFPSAHSATAAGLSVALAHFYPRGRYWFAFLALLAMCQRIDANAHFLSDTLAGASLGCLVGTLAMTWRARPT